MIDEVALAATFATVKRNLPMAFTEVVPAFAVIRQKWRQVLIISSCGLLSHEQLQVTHCRFWQARVMWDTFSIRLNMYVECCCLLNQEVAQRQVLQER